MPARLLILCIGLFFAAVVSGQSTSNPQQPPGVSVLESKWGKGHPYYDKRTPYDLTDYTANKVNENKQVLPPDSQRDVRRLDGSFPADVKEKMLRDLKASMYEYYYSIQVKNEGPKKIRSMAWDYIFNDPGSKQELERHSFRSFDAIGINQTRWSKIGPGPGPPQMVSAEGLQKDKRSPFDERIEIKCILYADGTGWRPSNKEQGVCDELMRYTLNPPRRRR